jgi:RNA polymerase sigma-70 factor (sigma-E family)
MADRSQFDAFVAASSRRLLGTAYLLTRDAGLAEDLLQTSLAKAWFAWDRIDDHPQAYVQQTIVHTYLSWWRRKWRHEVPHDELPEPAAAAATVDVDERADVWQALGRLPARQRAVIVLRFYEDLTEAQTADVLGCTVGTVKSQTSKAFAKLRLDPSVQPAPAAEGGVR